IPSPTSTTVPTLRVSVAASNESIDDLMMLVISSERLAVSGLLQGARRELVPQPLQATPDAPVDESVPDAHDQPAEEAVIDIGLELDPAAGHLLEAGREGPDLEVGQRRGARRGGVGDPLPSVVEPDELGDDARELLDPVAPDEQEDDVADGLAQVAQGPVRRLEPLVER